MSWEEWKLFVAMKNNSCYRNSENWKQLPKSKLETIILTKLILIASFIITMMFHISQQYVLAPPVKFHTVARTKW